VSRSSDACRVNIRHLLDTGKCWMWTFTFAEVLAIDEGCKRWSALSAALVREFGFTAVRVFELHPGGHGLHIHCVARGWYPIRRLRSLSGAYGFGRIHVTKKPIVNPFYICKYLGKEESAWCSGRRTWACVGFEASERTPCYKLVYDGLTVRAMKWTRALLPHLKGAAMLLAAFHLEWTAVVRGEDLRTMPTATLYRFLNDPSFNQRSSDAGAARARSALTLSHTEQFLQGSAS